VNLDSPYPLIKLTIAVIATFGLYSILYRETKFYRLFEHIFLGLAAGWAVVALWTAVLKELWWDRMIGVAAEGTPGTPDFQEAQPGHWLWAILLPVGLMGYFVFSRKHNWMSRIPIGIILGLWSGQQVQVWWTRYGPQIGNSLRPVIPTAWDSVLVPARVPLTEAQASAIAAAQNVSPDVVNQINQISATPPEAREALATQFGMTADQFIAIHTAATGAMRPTLLNNVYPVEAITNIIFIVTIVSVLSYFLFSFEIRNRLLGGMTVLGRWLLMVGFGAIFGSTVMTRFTLLIDRMSFVWLEWLRDTIIPAITRGPGGG
jgi:hypothetical protein